MRKLKNSRIEKFLRPFGSKRPEVERKFLRIEKLKSLSLAALLMAGAAFTACSSSSDEIIDKQPENPTAPKVYTLVIKASKGGEAKGGDTTTRALQEGYDEFFDENTLDAYWDGTETFEVVQDGNIIGTAHATASETGETNIIATLTNPNEEHVIKFYLNSHDGICDYRGQVGLLTGDEGNSISEKYDYAVAILSTANFEIDDNQIKIKNDATLNFNEEPFGYALQAIVKFTLKDKSDNAINATKLNIYGGEYGLPLYCNTNEVDLEYGDITISPSSGTDVIYAALRGVWGDLTLTANDGDNIYSYSKSSVGFSDGQYYEITVKMNKILARVTSGNAQSILAGGYTAITAEQAAALAKECWKVAGNTVYVVYSASGTIISPNVSYVYTSDGENTNEATATTYQQLTPLYAGGSNTAWFVEPAPVATGHALSSAQVGEIICSDGQAYAGSDYNILPSGVTAKAKVCYVSGDGHGLALALADEVDMDWSTARSTCAGKTPTVTGCTWKLATTDEWNNMISGAGGYVALRDGFESVGGTNMLDGLYWSSTEADDEWALSYDFAEEYSGWNNYFKSYDVHVRACLAF